MFLPRNVRNLRSIPAVHYDSGGAVRLGAGTRSCAGPCGRMRQPGNQTSICGLIFRPPVDGLAAAPGLNRCGETSRMLLEAGASRVEGTSAEALHAGLP